MALTKVSNLMLVQPVNHNILINPSFTVFQRDPIKIVENKDSKVGPDRWNFRGEKGVGNPGNKNTIVADHTTGVNKLVVKHSNPGSWSHTYQKIETVNLLGMYGKEMTFSFSYSDTGGSGIPRARIYSYDSSGAGKMLYDFYDKDGHDVIPTSLGNNRWSCTVTLSTGDGTIPDPSERGLQVEIYANESYTAPAEWSVWETKLEASPVATPFIARPYGEELLLCQRYYQKLPVALEPSSVSCGTGLWYKTSQVLGTLFYTTTMRAPPVVECSSDFTIQAYVAGDVRSSNSGDPLDNIGLNSARWNIEEFTGVGVAGEGTQLQITAGTLGLNAEL